MKDMSQAMRRSAEQSVIVEPDKFISQTALNIWGLEFSLGGYRVQIQFNLMITYYFPGACEAFRNNGGCQ